MTRQEAGRATGTIHRYRRLLLLGRIRLPFAPARRLLGPDCVYHLYGRHALLPAKGAGARRRRASATLG